jgi:glycosyltransferase involved in cell wall biosynthesis
LNAFKAVKNKYPDATLMLLGDGPLRESMERYVKEQNIKDVSFIGVVPNEKIYDYLNKADIMLSSPLIDNMPVSLLEAMNAGLLVISSNVGGVPYVVKNNHSGLLFKSDDDEELARKMLWALTNQNEAKNIILKAKENISHYRWENIKEQLYTAYGLPA